MANLDTRSKRASSVGFWKPYALALPLPDGSIGQGDRQHSAWDYSGILAAVVAPPSFPGGNATAVLFRDKRAIIPFRDKRAYVAYREKRTVTSDD